MFKSIVGGLGRSGVLAFRAARSRAEFAKSLASAQPTVSIAMYHDPQSLQLQQLLSKLMLYAELPRTLECYNKGLARSQPVPMMTLTLNPSASVFGPLKFTVHLRTREELSETDRAFILDECADIHPQNKAIADQSLSATEYPIIIDYSNRLLANDDASFDRIMQNYLTCGIQNARAGPVRLASRTSQSNMNSLDPSTLVHPHVAEFADLF